MENSYNLSWAYFILFHPFVTPPEPTLHMPHSRSALGDGIYAIQTLRMLQTTVELGKLLPTTGTQPREGNSPCPLYCFLHKIDGYGYVIAPTRTSSCLIETNNINIRLFYMPITEQFQLVISTCSLTNLEQLYIDIYTTPHQILITR